VTGSPALELRGIEKRFGSVAALDGADFVLAPGEVHGLLGANGAGKSTLMHIAFGLLTPDRGSILVRGEPVAMGSPADAKRLGLGMVHQHFTSIPALTVEENLWLAAGRHRSPMGQPPVDGAETAPGKLRKRLWAGVSPSVRVEDLPVSGKQRVELLQALATDAEILLLDEPTAVLAPSEVDSLLELLRAFADGGGSVVFITHKLNEVMAAVDRVTVLRNGRVTLTGPVADRTRAELAVAMIGEEGRAGIAAGARTNRALPLGPTRIRRPGLEVRAGEVIGIAAVEGNGQREVLRSLAGLAPRPPGTQVAEPIAFIPEDRTTEGLVPAFTVVENLVLGLPNDERWARGRWLAWGPAVTRTAELIGEFGIRTTGPKAITRNLSGGNQQKLMLARAVESRPAVVIAENPTRGLDVHATTDIHDRLRRLAADGAAVIVYSADLDEVLDLADRVMILYRGQLIEPPLGADRAVIGALMIGGQS
jgi:simple sugar transport system ATP-binding protein